MFKEQHGKISNYKKFVQIALRLDVRNYVFNMEDIIMMNEDWTKYIDLFGEGQMEVYKPLKDKSEYNL